MKDGDIVVGGKIDRKTATLPQLLSTMLRKICR